MSGTVRKVKLECDEQGYIQKVLLEPGSREVEWSFVKLSDEASSKGEGEQAPETTEESERPTEETVSKFKLGDRSKDESLLAYVKQFETCDEVVEVCAFTDPEDGAPFHRVPRAVSICFPNEEKQLLNALKGCFNFDFCRGVTVRRVQKPVDKETWMQMLSRGCGRSVGDPGIALEEELEVLRKFTFDFFAEDPILRAFPTGERTLRGEWLSTWKPQLTAKGKVGVFRRNDGISVEYYGIVEDGLPTWTSEQIGMLFDDLWSLKENVTRIASMFNFFNSLSKKRRERVLEAIFDERGDEDASNQLEHGDVVTNTISYGDNNTVWYTGGGFVNVASKKTWYTLPVSGSDTYVDVLFTDSQPRLRCYAPSEDEIKALTRDSVLFQKIF